MLNQRQVLTLQGCLKAVVIKLLEIMKSFHSFNEFTKPREKHKGT